ncbi:hypothetical protein MBAV_000648 [Candidatus Magnetobacterium bavaricum]|uniref:Uncharacterized protein n=1 Tax=Candidatus Magnetobacterium bavaricum TaxID=29290 RepID=A0A0F3GZ22_9BACT|nr:hypothetical protein MBAV_000648 [Candidatus Magnetobacterium bavaricum]
MEGERTEAKVYPKWLSYLAPQLIKVDRCKLAEKNNYYIFASNGQPSIIDDHLPDAIEEVNVYQQYNYLVVCLDAEENEVADKRGEVIECLSDKGLSLKNAKLEIVVQNRCLETWFLGNTRIYSRNPQNEDLRKYTKHFDVSTNDPELMPKHSDFEYHADFHLKYLKALFREKGITYSKSNPRHVTEEHYIQELIKRTSNYNHLATLKRFLDFCTTINNGIQA